MIEGATSREDRNVEETKQETCPYVYGDHLSYFKEKRYINIYYYLFNGAFSDNTMRCGCRFEHILLSLYM